MPLKLGLGLNRPLAGFSGFSPLDLDGLMLWYDERSPKGLAGATIDYTEELIGARFTINNPNASSSCGCGISFNI